ncbi:hypothetical protein AB1Y20_019106 [Prymnesium parvum]|uniref:Nop domain-containing protein n=1 Tax=Prymnesium parvum TaxID=97485 RepID=A0AB34JTI6_PRYPA|mmetsp:Transcript_24377/g.60481  ORF Transcript_24377/g.60481 Transcript_24377/m.60481 type:complete len:471 (-) Transcript_24377:208-1620(-)
MSLETFLADLDDLNEDEGGNDEEDEAGEEEGADDDDDLDMLAEDDTEMRAASGLLKSAKMTSVMQRIESAMASEDANDTDSADYDLIVACNEMIMECDNEIEAIAKTIRDAYAKRFPELDSLILNPLDYARVVLKLGNEIELTEVDLTGILPSATIMVVTVTASTTIGMPLPEDQLAAVIESCEQVLTLSENKQKMLAFVESRMSVVCPNLSALIGTTIAAKLLGAAGGLHKLASLPSTVVQILGSKKRALGGMSTVSIVGNAGFIQYCDIVQNTPPNLRSKVTRLVAGKASLAARCDTYQDKEGGAIGQRFKDEIEVKATKLQEPPPPKVTKALPVPPESSGKRRGGRRLRKMKERYGMSQMRQLSNRVRFGEEEDTTSDGLLGVGMLGKGQQTGKVRVSAKEQKLLSEKNKKRSMVGGGSGATNGLASSLAFTPVQGIELVNPNANTDSKEGTETYFTKTAAFFKNNF